MTPDIATRYRFAQESLSALARTLPAEAWSTPVPCTPEWTVRDVRHAVGRPGNRDSIVIEAMAFDLASIADCPVALDVVVRGRTIRSGPAEGPAAVVLPWISSFELFRSRPGRRSRAQMRAWKWVGEDADIDAVLDGWVFFGPTPTDIVE